MPHQHPVRAAAAVSLLALLGLTSQPALALDNGLALKPVMGWSSWNAYHRNFSASVFMAAADAMSTNGMQEAGYQYINVDGGWWAGSDTGHVVRNASGFASYNPDKYPAGIKAVVDYIHSKGFLYGHYTDAGTAACNKDAPMSEGYEAQDVALFAEWGFDMLKLDACHVTEASDVVVDRWRKLLNESGRRVLFSDCHNGCETNSPWKPWCGNSTNMWRSSKDIQPTWASVMYNLDSLKGRGSFGAPGRWNDPDFLEVGLGEFADDGSALALNKNRAHFSMWAITSSPLIASLPFDNPSVATPRMVSVLTHPDVIAINQQYMGNAGDFIRGVVGSGPHPSDGLELWAKPLPGSSAAVAVLNRGNAAATMTFKLSEIPGIASGVTTCKVKHVWDGDSGTITGGQFTTPSLSTLSVGLMVLSGCQ